jgi:hypothetical protein
MPQATQSDTPLAVGCDQSELHVLCSILPVRGGRSPLPLICLRCTSIDRALKSEIERPIQFSTE